METEESSDKPANGSIPACAGEPSSSFMAGQLQVFGLSPRVRGNR